LLTQYGRPCTTSAPWRHARYIEQVIDFSQSWRFYVLAQGRADYRWPHPVYPVVWRQDDDLPPTTEQGQETRFSLTGDADESRPSTAHQPLDLGIGRQDRFDLHTEVASGPCQPPAEGLIAVLSQARWRR
jgi:hypothetical protein